MKSFFLLCIITFLLPLNSNAQLLDTLTDNLFEIREMYSSQKNFNEYCRYKYMLCKYPIAPPPPVNSELKKYFNIPTNIRLKIYPFNEYDSISVYLTQTYKDKIIILDNQHKSKLSDIVFNYAYYGDESVYYSIINGVECLTITFLFYSTLNGTYRYVELYDGGRVNTNFTGFELSQFNLDRDKIELFIKKLNIK